MARALLLAGAEEERLKRQLILDRRQIRMTSRPMDLPEREFIRYFRLRKSLFRTLCAEICPLFLPTHRSSAVPPELKVLAALTFYAHGCYQKNVGTHFNLGLSQTTTSVCIRDVSDALNSPAILRKYIVFPRTNLERESISLRFMEKFGMPGVMGCIDGTHVAIVKPAEQEEVFFNRKNYHSLNVLVICDADLRILHVDASFGGASHDSHVWNNCPVKQLMEDLHDQQESYWLLGDSGYAQRPWMMTPILHATPDSPEEHYTTRQILTRNVIERCFGVLKTRWRCLLAHRTMHYHPVKSGKIVNACVVLHNMINDARIRIDHEAMARDRARQPPHQAVHPMENVRDGGGAVYTGTREALVQRLWQRR